MLLLRLHQVMSTALNAPALMFLTVMTLVLLLTMLMPLMESIVTMLLYVEAMPVTGWMMIAPMNAKKDATPALLTGTSVLTASLDMSGMMTIPAFLQ